MNRAQFTFYRSYYDAIKVLPKKEQTAVLLAICAYALDGEEPKLAGTASAIFTLVRPTLDASRKKAESGKRGGESKQTESKPEANGKQGASEKENKKEKEKEKEKEGEKEDECPPPTPSRSKFIPPTLEEVEAYCRERNSTVDPRRFYEYFTTGEWKDAKGNPVKNWKQKIITWERKSDGHSRRDTGFETSNPFLEMLDERRRQG